MLSLARHEDPIVAVATASGRGAVGIVRISGTSLAPLVAAICGRALVPRQATFGPFLDAAGTPITMPQGRRVIGISAAQLAAVPDVICVAHGRERAPAVRAAVRAGCVTTLVTTAALAAELIREDP